MPDTTTPPRRSQRGEDVWPARPAKGSGPETLDPSLARDRAELFALLVRRLSRYHVRPDDAIDFTLQGEADRAAANTIDLPNSLEIPEGYVGVIEFLQLLSTVCDATSAGQSFALKVNGADVPGYGGLVIFQAGGAQAVDLETFIEVGERQSIEVAHTGVASARHVGYMVRGYLAPKGAAEGRE
jgi:hypothetical protein